MYSLLLTPEVEFPIERYLNIGMVVLIVLNVLAVILETETKIYQPFRSLFDGFEVFSVVVFTIEYLARLWAVTLDPRYGEPVSGRLHFAVTPMMMIDLAAFLPFYLPWSALDLRFLRAVRLFRLFRLFKMGRYSKSLQTLGEVIRSKKEELGITVFAGVILLIIASSLMYLVESPQQPEKFSSIPASMWWGVATLTTIGYGDIFPITTFGKILGSFIAMLGIGLFAMPTGIIAGGFAERLHREDKNPIICPHCGKEIEDFNKPR